MISYGSMSFTDTRSMRRDSEPMPASGEEEEQEQQVTFEDLGVPRPHSQSVVTSFGKRRSLSSLSTGEWAFGLISVLSILGTLGLTVERLVNAMQSKDAPAADVTYAMVLLVTIVFCLLYILNGIFGERPFELVIFIVGTLLLMIYCTVNYIHSVSSGKQLSNRDYIIKLVRLILIVAVGPINIGMASFYAREYHWSKNFVFRLVGASVDLQDLCYKFFMTESFFKMDLQLQISLVILVLKEGLSDVTHFEIIVLSVGGVYAIAWFILGYLSISTENKLMVNVVLATSWCEPAYIIYKLVDVVMDWENLMPSISAGIIIAGVLGLALRVTLCAFLVYVYRNFGRGVRYKAYGVTGGQTEASKDTAPITPESTSSNQA